MAPPTNTYSSVWFDVFLETHPFTDSEVAFLCRQLPLPGFRNVLDVACGRGRHAIPLANAGRSVTGIDRDVDAIERASAATVGLEAHFEIHDMRHLSRLDNRFDAVLLLWQSFGFFSTDVNRQVLADMASLLRPGGRLVLDVYNRSYWKRSRGVSVVTRGGVESRIVNRFGAGRLRTTITYGDTKDQDMFDWQLFTPDELVALGEQVGLAGVLLCTEYEEAKSPDPQSKAFQVVFER